MQRLVHPLLSHVIEIWFASHFIFLYSGRLFLEVEINMDLHFLEICSLSASIYHARDLKDFCVATELNSLMLYFVF
jgi:hypothetical protein